MKKFAVVQIGGFQYRVEEGQEFEVPKVEGKKGKKLVLDKVLLFSNGKKLKIGRPLVKGGQIEAEVVDQIKGEKIRVATYKAKSRYRRVKGFRPQLTRLRVVKFSFA